TSSGTSALTAAIAALGIGPGDEVIVPAHTYMATAVAVVAAGAIPVIADIDESITLDPAALDDAVGPRTRAVIPVHMWGVVCDMDAIMRVARRRKLLVIEDACQCVGGAYEGRPVGSIGHAAAFSFNYFKNMTCGEGGAVVTNKADVARRAACVIDCCSFYWSGRRKDFEPFCSNGSRPSEFEGAIMLAQLKRLPGMIRTLRRMKARVLRQTAGTGLLPATAHSPEHECGLNVIYQLPTAAAAERFNELAGGMILARTGRHTYTEWDPILTKSGACHPAMNPFKFAANRGCRMNYRKDMCPRTLDILNRSVMIGMHPDRTAAELKALVAKIRRDAKEVLGSQPTKKR
ncbi:MAG: aminotransferase class V-fold PLP-dependent enzyme, partial [Planctomycetes bacterium]|nr:aminotransferase class V-fold PLP-dependent enzyme [Planctomycetota bacterium]